MPGFLPRRRAAFRIHGMDCAEEVSLLRRTLSETPGITELTFDALQGRMEVEYDPERVSPGTIIAAVERAGMAAEPWETPSQRPAWREWIPAFQILASGSLFGCGTVMKAVAGGGWATWFADHEGPLPAGAVFCYLGAIAAGFGPFLPRAWAALRRLRPDMNVLVAVSLVGAGFLGEWSEAAALAFLFALAGRLERWSLELARRSITSLFAQAPRQAAVLHSHGEHLLPVERVPVGSLVRVRPGEKIPCDGEVVRGESKVNQAILTGESVAVPKRPGSRVYAGTLNISGILEIRTTSHAADSTSSRIARMLGASTRRRAPSERLVERFARVYTPFVLAIAIVVAFVPPVFFGGAWSRWLHEGMVVLLIACPCALVISTPVTVAAALASAARQGVLVKGGAFLEELARVQAIGLEKAGVLTLGCPDEGEDPPREEAGQALQELRREGIAVHEGQAPPLVVGGSAWVTSSGSPDGNHLTIAFGSQSLDAALENVEVVILADDLRRIPLAVRHARRGLRVIRQNVAIAVGLKLAFLAVALSGSATLWMALVADMGATWLVVLNGLRMLWVRR